MDLDNSHFIIPQKTSWEVVLCGVSENRLLSLKQDLRASGAENYVKKNSEKQVNRDFGLPHTL
jgi:hypothetical protein